MKSTQNGYRNDKSPHNPPLIKGGRGDWGAGVQLELPLSYGFFLRPAEAARILRVAQSTIYQMVADGRLRAVNLNEGTALRPCLRIPRNAVEGKISVGEL